MSIGPQTTYDAWKLRSPWDVTEPCADHDGPCKLWPRCDGCNPAMALQGVLPAALIEPHDKEDDR